MIIDSDFHLQTFCDPVDGGCGAKPGENCLPDCITYDDGSDSIEWRDAVIGDPDVEYDRLVDGRLGL